MIINTTKHLWLALLLVAAGALTAPREAVAQGVYFTKRAVLSDFFRHSERVTYRKLAVGPAQRQRLRSRLGYVPSRAQWTLYYGLTGGHIDGLALIDNEPGQHKPITFAVLMSPNGAMRRLEIMVYREGHGDAVRSARFRNQFGGKTLRDPIRQGADIVAISGATISSKAMARGARRALAIVNVLVLKAGGLQSLLAKAH